MDDTIFQRFKREASTLETLDHPNIVEFVEFGETAADAYLVMEYIEGVSLEEVFTGLRSFIDRRPIEEDLLQLLRIEKAPPPSFHPENRQRAYFYKIVEWISQATSALEHIHEQGILHRDIKHANIMIERGTGRAVLLDFGLSKNQEMTLTLEGQFLGSVRFSSPEQLEAARHTSDERSDIYSMGIVLYELLALRTSFFGENFEQLTRQILSTEPTPLRQLNSSLPVDLQTITHRCIEKHPAQRFPRALALYDDLLNWLQNRPIKASPPNRLHRTYKWARRFPVRMAVIGTSAAAFLVIVGIVSYFFVRLVG